MQLLATDLIQSFTRSERNIQILCDVNFPTEMLKHASNVLSDEGHYLHGPLLAIFEQLARQALEPKDLRAFLRLGHPLNCLLPEDGGNERNPLPLARLKSLVSMSMPREMGRSSHGALFCPPFVEFDMAPEGFGCLFMPSVAPQCQPGNPTGPSGAAGPIVMGGVGGGGDRVFPAPTGMSYSTWICVDKFGDPRVDPHPVRLLTLVRNVMERPDENLICLSVVMSARDKAVLVSTAETPLPRGSSDWEPEVSGDFGARIWTPDLIQEGQWHHLALVWSRAVLKSSQFSLFVDGQLVHSGKVKCHTFVGVGLIF